MSAKKFYKAKLIKSREYATIKVEKRAPLEVMKMGEIKANTYDDVFRTLTNDHSPLILPVINEAFGEHYTGNERIVFKPNEEYLKQQGGDESKRITDTNFIVMGDEPKNYHWECQSTTDNSMLIRMFEYDAQIALKEGETVADTLKVRFPHSAIMYLRCTESTPDQLFIQMIAPDGQSIKYAIPTLKVKRYSIDEIFSKNLLFLIPFYIFTHESKFKKMNEDEVQLETLLDEYKGIAKRLNDLAEAGQIEEYTKKAIMDMSGKIMDLIASHYERVKEGVKSIMSGQVLDYEAKRIWDESKLATLFGLVKDGLLTAKDASIRAEMSEEEFAARAAKAAIAHA